MLRTHRARNHRTASLLAAALAVTLALAPSAARADSAKIVVTTFKGPTRLAAQAREHVIRALGERYEFVDAKELDAARARLGVDGEDATAFGKLAAELGVDGIVTGEVSRESGKYVTTVAVHTRDGAQVELTSIRMRGRRVGSVERRAIRKQVPAMMDAFDARREQLAAAPPEPEPEPEPEPPTAAGAPVVDDEIPEGADERPGVFKRKPKSSGGGGGGGPAITGSVNVGGAFIGRDLSFDVGGDIAAAMLPNEYSGPPSLGFRVAGEVFALGALASAARPISIAFVVDRSLFLTSNFEEEEFPTAQTRIGVGAFYTYSLAGAIDPIGGSEQSPSVRGGVGFERASFAIESGDVDTGIPDVTYDSVSVGAGARVPVMRKLAVHTDFAFLLGLAAGDINEMDNFGDGAFTGLEWDLGASYEVIDSVNVQGGFRLMRMGLSFDGNGALSDLDNDGTADVAGASDLYLGFYVTGGYRF